MAVSHNVQVPYLLIINTNRYTGNFERELCAYATGGIGECEKGKRQALDFEEHLKELGLEEYLVSRCLAHPPDDNGHRRPVSIWHDDADTERYHSLAIFLHNELGLKELEIVRARVLEYAADKDIVITGMRIVKRTIKVIDETIDRWNNVTSV